MTDRNGGYLPGADLSHPKRATGGLAISIGRSIAVVAVLFALQIADGIDQTALALVAPFVRADLGIGTAALGAALSAAFFGTAIGSIVFGIAGDRIGRRFALCCAATGFSLGSLATLLVRTGPELIAIRFITGIALGGLFPVIASIVIDLARTGRRVTTVTLVSVGTAVGTSLCGPLVAALQPRFGWQSIFVVGGALPAILIVIAVALIPSIPLPVGTARSSRPHNPLNSVATLFADGRWRPTLLIWVAFIGVSMPMFFSLSWLPSLAHAAGLSLRTAALGPSMFAAAGILVALVVARLLDRVGLRALVMTSALGVPAFIVLGQAFGSAATFLPACAVTGGLCVSCVNLMGAVAATHYPAELRARGVGWALAVMRFGGAVAPGIGGLLIAHGVGPGPLFAGVSIGLVITAVAVGRLRDRHLT